LPYRWVGAAAFDVNKKFTDGPLMPTCIEMFRVGLLVYAEADYLINYLHGTESARKGNFGSGER
jgi:hypothetical protein